MSLTKQDLDLFFKPKHVAIVGVSSKSTSFGGASFLAKLLQSGFQGRLFPINPKAVEIQGLRAYPDLSSLPYAPDLVLTAVAAAHVPSVLEECARIGSRHIHILSSGFSELGTQGGRDLEDRIIGLAREKDLLILGPNCMGSYCPASKLTAWGAIPGLAGPVGVISQSGGMTQRLTEYICSLGLGVAKAASVGNGAVIGAADLLSYMAEDDEIKLAAMYLEGVRDGRGFLELVREVCRKKPVVLWKGGESDVGARTAASHTGAMGGQATLWRSFFQQTGAIQVRSMDEWADLLLAAAHLPAPQGRGVFIIGGGGGNSVTYSDACIRLGLDVPALSGPTMAFLEKTVPAAGSISGNPLDMWVTFEDVDYLFDVLDLADQDPRVDMIVVDRLIPRAAFHINELPGVTERIIEGLTGRGFRKPIVMVADFEGGDRELAAKGAHLRKTFCQAGIPAYPSLERAARALVKLHRYHSRQSGSLQ